MTKKANHLGVICGAGGLPSFLIEKALNKGYTVTVGAMEGITDPVLKSRPGIWRKPFQLFPLLRDFRARGIYEIIIIGKMPRPRLWEIISNNFHWRVIGFFVLFLMMNLVRRGESHDNQDLALLSRMIEADGFKIVSPADLLSDCVAHEGLLIGAPLTHSEQGDAEAALDLLREHGRQDKGQALVFKGREILALEGREGTDAMIVTAGGRGGFLLKAAKPQQNLRDDMPVIGPDTVSCVCESGLDGMIVVVGEVLIMDPAETMKRAEAAGIRLIGLAGQG